MTKNIQSVDFFEITGTMKYSELETGVWQMVDNDGKLWIIVNLPDDLKKENLQINVTASFAKNNISFFMLGELIEIFDYQILKV